jgi:hypothetical protein
VHTLRGEPWPPQKSFPCVLLSQRDVILGAAPYKNRWGVVWRDQKDEIIRRNHPGGLSTLESFWWIPRRGIAAFALIDRSLLQGIRRGVGDKVLLFIPLSATILHSDGTREECWLTETGEPQVAFLPSAGKPSGKGSEQKPLLLKKAFPSTPQVKRARVTRTLLGICSIFLFCFLALAPWLQVLENHHDVLQREVNKQERLARVGEWERALTGESEIPEPSVFDQDLGVPWRFLEDLYRRTSNPLGIEVFSLGQSQFRLRLWGENFHDLTRSFSGDPGIYGLEFAEYPEGGASFGEPGLLSLSLTGGYSRD